MTSIPYVERIVEFSSKNIEINTTTNSTNFTLPAQNITCAPYDVLVETWLLFDVHQLARVLITWSLFVLSATGNVFVIYSLRLMKRQHHFFMFHLALADLAYACFVLPTDAIWNTTMQWYSGDAVCKLVQMLKQFGMYSSSFMVVVIGVDRVRTVLYPIAASKTEHLGVVMVSVAWAASAVCTIPAGIVFSILRIPTCEGVFITQCVDNEIVPKQYLNSYHFFSMLASFLLPFFSTIVSYSLIVCEISKMKKRDRQLMGRRNSVNSESIQKAINRTILMRTLITLTFLLCWGPYYAKGIVDWFIRDISMPEPGGTVYKVSYILMYFNCFLHPIVFGVFLKEVRKNFQSCFKCFFRRKDNPRITFKPAPKQSNASHLTCSSNLLSWNTRKTSALSVSDMNENPRLNLWGRNSVPAIKSELNNRTDL
ncbi:gonadotropin-releasing hormone receptor-like [Styela clava]|uniref:gonadotropin-releasing hormone receptor-like n=1 Tax=Styela clava TaxID=7725 RepID=UPI00193A484B|nr:gonadotropin-releasing hormone receptor-like [Styela clava]